jgi:nucleotide-binding universal stress UspA family protein
MMNALLGEPRTVLLALDQSPGAEFAFDWAVKNYCKSNDNIHLLYVRRNADGITEWKLPVDIAGKVEREAETGSALLQKYIDRATQANLNCKGRTVVGDEREEICKEVLRACADVLIVGSRGLNRVQRVFLGSVSEYCAHQSACPVIIVKPSSSITRINSDDSIDSSSEMHIPGLDSVDDP